MSQFISQQTLFKEKKKEKNEILLVIWVDHNYLL